MVGVFSVCLDKVEEHSIFSNESIRDEAILLWAHKLSYCVVESFCHDSREDLIVSIQ